MSKALESWRKLFDNRLKLLENHQINYNCELGEVRDGQNKILTLLAGDLEKPGSYEQSIFGRISKLEAWRKGEFIVLTSIAIPTILVAIKILLEKVIS